MKITNNTAQSTLEYAVLITCIIAALISMQIYFKRGLSGRLRQTGDEIGEQYEPGKTTGTLNSSLSKDNLAEIIPYTEDITVDTESGPVVVSRQGSERWEWTYEKSKTWGDETVGAQE